MNEKTAELIKRVLDDEEVKKQANLLGLAFVIGEHESMSVALARARDAINDAFVKAKDGPA